MLENDRKKAGKPSTPGGGSFLKRSNQKRSPTQVRNHLSRAKGRGIKVILRRGHHHHHHLGQGLVQLGILSVL